MKNLTRKAASLFRRLIPADEKVRGVLIVTVAITSSVIITVGLLSIVLGIKGAVTILISLGGFIAYKIWTRPRPPSEEMIAIQTLWDIHFVLDNALRGQAHLLGLNCEINNGSAIYGTDCVKRNGRLYYAFRLRLVRPLVDLDAATDLIQTAVDIYCVREYNEAKFRIVDSKTKDMGYDLYLLIGIDARRPNPNTPPSPNTPPPDDNDFN
jgi:hypothetical protein